MSETKQTRCPFCNSVFNITDAQLAARGGHVRCGSCLQVFRADQNLVTGAAVTPTAQPKAPPPPPPEAAVSEKPIAPPIVAHTQSAVAPGDQPIGQRKKKKLEDDSWAFNLLGDESEDLTEGADLSPAPSSPPAAKPSVADTPPPPAKTKKPLFDDELSDMLHEAWQDNSPSSGPKLGGHTEVDKIKVAADDSWAQALLSEIAEEEKKEQAKNHSMEVVNPNKPKPREPARPATTQAERPSPAPASRQDAPQGGKPGGSGGSGGSSDDDLLNFLNSNSAPTLSQAPASLPVELHAQRHLSVNWGYYITWTLLCSLAIAAFAAQFIYFNFEKLSVSPDTRPKMLALCETLGCKAPEPPNVALLSIRKLVVRRHPEASNALQADAILFNKADFTQPLPALKLLLVNKKGDIVAGRIFQPQEYLSSDFSNLRRIPPDTPIHVELNVIKPSVAYAGYRMEPLL